ncbi:MAG TPA: hypothetical protein VFZ53_16880 [Polyangiaceae bacterium]
MKRALASTLTVRLPTATIARVRERARSLGVTPSRLVRATLEKELGGALNESDLFSVTRPFIGSVNGGRRAAARHVRRDLDRWNPDRRG